MRLLVLGMVLAAFSAGAVGARADDRGGRDGGEVRATAACASGASSALRLRVHDRGIEARFRLRQARGRGVWRVTIVHERRVSSRVTKRTTRSVDSFEIRRVLPDLPGSDTVSVHAWGPSGRWCRVTATLPREAGSALDK
jgi:hypothetical protein